MLNIYHKKGRSAGYINWKKLLNMCKLTPFIFAHGGRGTGKTYGVLELVLGLGGDEE